MTIAHQSHPVRAPRGRGVTVVALAATLALAACGGGAGEDTASVAATPRPAASASARAPGDSSCPLTGAWRECSILDRLEKAGMAPARIGGTVERDGFTTPGIRYALGKATLEVFLYASEAERVRVVGALDSATASPPGRPTDWPKPPVLMASGNMAAVFHGGRAREAERVALALTAGLPER